MRSRQNATSLVSSRPKTTVVVPPRAGFSVVQLLIDSVLAGHAPPRINSAERPDEPHLDCSRTPASTDPGRWRAHARAYAPPVNATVPLTSFVGRRAELAQLRSVIASARLVTLVGPAGIGKTRLALELARRAARPSEIVGIAELAPL